MIKLSHNPFEGSAVKIQLSFKDNYGNYYIPISVNYSVLALNKDKESWSVVEDAYEKNITPASTIVLTVDKLKTYENTTSQRKVVVAWTAYVDGEVTDFVDEVTFEIQPKPYIINPPTPIHEVYYVEIKDVALQIGSKESTAIKPVFYLNTNVPVDLTDSEIQIYDSEGNQIPTYHELNSSKTIITVTTDDLVLNKFSYYDLKINGLKAFGNEYGMKEEFVYRFRTSNQITDASELSEVIEQIQNRIETNEENIVVLDGKVEENANNISEMNTEMSSIGNKVSEIELNATVMGDRLIVVESELPLIKEDIKTNSDKIKNLGTRVDNVIASTVEINKKVEENTADIEDIKKLIPSQASEENELADKEYVKNSIDSLFTQAQKDAIDSGVNSELVDEWNEKMHTHDNKDIIDSLGEDEDGNLIYKGEKIEGGEPETATVDFSDFEDFEEVVVDASVEGENLIVGEHSNLSLDIGSTLVIDDVEREVSDEDARDAISNLQDVLIPGDGIAIAEDGTISLTE